MSDTATPETAPLIDTLVAQIARRLGDANYTVWTAAEIERYLADAYQHLALRTRCFWDQLYLENWPDAFSMTAAWEAEYADFDYGVANYTLADERRLLDEANRIGPGNHTCPDEATGGHLSACGATAVGDACVDLPETLTEIDRATWDGQTIDAALPQQMRRIDPQYETTQGPVYAYLWREDGVRTFRHVRSPSEAAAVYTVSGAWGSLRTPTDLSSDTVTGTWGVARRIPDHHPLHGEVWGLPRRPYQDSTATKIEHWREGRLVGTRGRAYELPARYATYLRHYALSECHARSGPGHDPQLAAWYRQLWERGIARILRRIQALDAMRVAVFGEGRPLASGAPPRPRLPWNYPQRTR